MYKGQSGMWSWLLHRVTGLGVLLFLLVHIVDISLLGFGPKVYDEGINLFGTTVVRIISLALIAAIFVRVAFSWIGPNPRNRLFMISYQITEPVLAPIRNLLPRGLGIDLSPMIAIFVLVIVDRLVVSAING